MVRQVAARCRELGRAAPLALAALCFAIGVAGFLLTLPVIDASHGGAVLSDPLISLLTKPKVATPPAATVTPSPTAATVTTTPVASPTSDPPPVATSAYQYAVALPHATEATTPATPVATPPPAVTPASTVDAAGDGDTGTLPTPAGSTATPPAATPTPPPWTNATSTPPGADPKGIDKPRDKGAVHGSDSLANTADQVATDTPSNLQHSQLTPTPAPEASGHQHLDLQDILQGILGASSNGDAGNPHAVAAHTAINPSNSTIGQGSNGNPHGDPPGQAGKPDTGHGH